MTSPSKFENRSRVLGGAADARLTLWARPTRTTFIATGAIDAAGVFIAEVASRLHLSEGTVRNYLSEAIQKLDARNRIEAAQIAEQKGWL